MQDPFKSALALCTTLIRNGFDAYIINAQLQQQVLNQTSTSDTIEMDIAANASIDDLIKLFPETRTSGEPYALAALERDGFLFRFYPVDVVESSHPDTALARITMRLLRKLDETQELPTPLACSYLPRATDEYEGFKDVDEGSICFKGLPDETLKQNYLRGVRALRFAANYHLPIEENTWISIIRGAQSLLDYVAFTDIMNEWRKVEAENMHAFVRMLFDTQILRGLMPEIAALSRLKQTKPDGDEEIVFEHTLETMRRYPEELPYDWFGTFACMFKDVGKLYTAEYINGAWTFYQCHFVGAKVTRRILQRLRFDPVDTDLICLLVKNHDRFNYMLTDRGLQHFKALDEFPRLIEIARATIKATNGSYAAFNSNMKNLERTATPGEMPEPLLNGNEIMDFAGIRPGPAVGLIREALIAAQITGEVLTVPDAVEFIARYKDREML